MENTDLLAHSPLFTGFEDAERRAFIDAAQSRSVPEGHVFMRLGDRNASLFIICSGKVKVEHEAGTELATLTRGGTFGEMSFWDVSRVTATLTAKEPTEVLELSVKAVESLLAGLPQTGTKFWRNIAMELKQRLERTNKLVSQYVDLSDALSEDSSWGSLFGK